MLTNLNLNKNLKGKNFKIKILESKKNNFKD